MAHPGLEGLAAMKWIYVQYFLQTQIKQGGNAPPTCTRVLLAWSRSIDRSLHRHLLAHCSYRAVYTCSKGQHDYNTTRTVQVMEKFRLVPLPFLFYSVFFPFRFQSSESRVHLLLKCLAQSSIAMELKCFTSCRHVYTY